MAAIQLSWGHPPLRTLKDMLIGVTNFFRDREAFEALKREVMPRICDAKDRRQNTTAVRNHKRGGPLACAEVMIGDPVGRWKHSNPASGSALAEKPRCGIPVNGSAAMTDTAMVHVCGVPAAG
ncbi:hypothetical protein SB861_50000 [Paraburkholderia sp. SIMBA_049]